VKVVPDQGKITYCLLPKCKFLPCNAYVFTLRCGHYLYVHPSVMPMLYWNGWTHCQPINSVFQVFFQSFLTLNMLMKIQLG